MRITLAHVGWTLTALAVFAGVVRDPRWAGLLALMALLVFLYDGYAKSRARRAEEDDTTGIPPP